MMPDLFISTVRWKCTWGVCHCICPMQCKNVWDPMKTKFIMVNGTFSLFNKRTRSSRYVLFLCSWSFPGPRSYTRYRVHPCMKGFNLVAPLIHRLFAPIDIYIYIWYRLVIHLLKFKTRPYWMVIHRSSSWCEQIIESPVPKY